MTAETETPYVGDFLKDSPTNWGRWGPDDEIGSLNYLTSAGHVWYDRKIWNGFDAATTAGDTFLDTAAPSKVVGGTGAPVNPVVIR